MHFNAVCLGFNNEGTLTEAIKNLSEYHYEHINYIENGCLKEDTVEAVGTYDYYNVLGYASLEDVLHIGKNWLKEDIYKAKFSLKDYIYQDIYDANPESEYYKNEYSLDIISYHIINKPGWSPYWARGIPGAVTAPWNKNHKIIYISSPVTVIEFTKETTLWERLQPLYRIYNDLYMPKTMYVINCHK